MEERKIEKKMKNLILGLQAFCLYCKNNHLQLQHYKFIQAMMICFNVVTIDKKLYKHCQSINKDFDEVSQAYFYEIPRMR